MVYTIICYFNTGFDFENIPDSPGLLATATSTTFDSNFYYQNTDKSQARIRTTFDVIQDVDYVSIGDSYYFVTGINMVQENTAELTLIMDYITTCGGISSIDVNDGWCRRAHAGSDELFENVLDEPFVPSHDIVMDNPMQFSDYDPLDTGVLLVGATIDLTNTEKLADQYLDGSDNPVVAVPKVTPVEYGTVAGMFFRDDNSQYRQTVLPNLALFWFRDVQEGIRSARSLGLDSAITACYRIPSFFIEEINPTDSLTDPIITITTKGITWLGFNLPFRYNDDFYTPQNTKIFSKFNNYTLSSVCSGDTADFEAFEIYNNGDVYPSFYAYADPQPNGCPYIQPSIFNGLTPELFMQTVKGMPWQNTPFSFGEKSGSLLDTVTFERKRNRESINFLSNTVQRGIGLGTSIASNPLASVNTGISAAQSTFNDIASAREDIANFNTEQRIRVPELVFPRDESIQNYIGNGFVLSRTRLHMSDLIRFDRFLTMYGYSQDKALEITDFTNRQYFNFVQADNISIKSTKGLRFRMGAKIQLSNGIRVWHTLPDASYYNSNPIVT